MRQDYSRTVLSKASTGSVLGSEALAVGGRLLDRAWPTMQCIEGFMVETVGSARDETGMKSNRGGNTSLQ